MTCAVAAVLTACGGKKFHVEGEVTGAKDSVLYFENVGLNGIEEIGTVTLGEDGKFELTGSLLSKFAVLERDMISYELINTNEEQLTSEENPAKTLTTGFSLNESGKAEEKWVIERLENEIKAEDRLSTSAAANSEILFSLMVNPSVLGAGLPGGPYAGNA